MNISVDDIWQLVKNGRSAQTDWFGEQTSTDTLASTLTAMANSQGGTVLLGVIGPTGNLIGIRNVANTVDLLLQAALSIDPPLIIPLPQVMRINGKAVIVAHIPPGMPHVYALDGRYLQRQGTENTPIKSRDLRRLIMERGEASFETEMVRGASLSDIDWEKAKAYAGSLSGIGETSVERILLKRGCLV